MIENKINSNNDTKTVTEHLQQVDENIKQEFDIVDKIFQQADEDMKNQLKSFDAVEKNKKGLVSTIKKNFKNLILLVIITLIAIFGLGIFYGIKSYKQIKADLLFQVESYRFEYSQLNESNLTNREIATKKMFTFFSVEELENIFQTMSLEEIGTLLSFTNLEYLDNVPVEKREDYKKMCFFIEYITTNQCEDELFTEELKQKYFDDTE